jgi:hypothetical protein
MSDQEDARAASNARGASGPRAGNAADRHDERGKRPWRRSEFPSDEAAFASCKVKSHEDFPRHIYRPFLILGIQFRWFLTRGTLAHALVSSAELAIDDAKENTSIEMYDHDRDTLEDILYRRLQDLWSPLTDSIKVFDAHGAAQPFCAQKSAVNHHFASVTELHRTMGYIGNLSIEDVLKSFLMATLKASTNSSLRAATTRSSMTSMTPKTCLSLSSKTLTTANFAATLTIADRLATLTSVTLLQGVATILELQGVTPAHPAQIVNPS